MTTLPKIIAYCRSLKIKNPTADPVPGSILHGTEEMGAQFAEGFQAVQGELSAIKSQGNFNGSGQPAAPPKIDAFKVSTGPGGEFQIQITDNGQVSRGINYWAEHDTTPAFSNPHAIDMGQSRNYSGHLGNQTLFWRGYSSYASSPPSPPVYHGSASDPLPVTGGVAGLRAPSEGTGTGAPAHGAQGPGPVPARTPTSGYNWKAQRAQATPGASQAGVTPAGLGGTAGAGSGGGGGGSTSISESTIAPCETLSSVTGTNTIAAVTAVPYSALSANFEVRLIPANTNSGPVTLNVNSIGAKAVTKNGTAALISGDLQAGQEYVLLYDGTQFQIVGLMASMVHGDFTVSAAALGVLTTVNTSAGVPGTFGDGTHVAQVTINAKGLVTAVASVAITGASPIGSALTSGNIIVGSGSNLAASVAMSQDVTIDNTGATTVNGAQGDFAGKGNIEAITAGKGLQIKSGSNARIGSGALVGGTLAVANTSVTANTKIFVQDTGGGVAANIGSLYVASKTPTTGFTVTSNNPLDTSNFDYFLVEAI